MINLTEEDQTLLLEHIDVLISRINQLETKVNIILKDALLFKSK